MLKRYSFLVNGKVFKLLAANKEIAKKIIRGKSKKQMVRG